MITNRTSTATGTFARRARRAAWLLLAAALTAGKIFEATKHGGWTTVTAIAGAIGPDLSFLAGGGQPHEPRALPARAVPLYNLVHRVWLPLLLIVFFTVVQTDREATAAGFTLGIAWLAHVAFDRSFGYGLRAADGTHR